MKGLRGQRFFATAIVSLFFMLFFMLSFTQARATEHGSHDENTACSPEGKQERTRASKVRQSSETRADFGECKVEPLGSSSDSSSKAAQSKNTGTERTARSSQ
jgi:hypothetical protein